MSRKTKHEEKETSVNVGQSMTAMARRGEKVARKRAINVVVMHEEDDMAGTKRDGGKMPIPAGE